MARVTFENVSKCFGSVDVIRSLNLTIPDGEFVVLVGPSGCGKTTTLRMLAGLEEVSGGRILIDDNDVTHLWPGLRNCSMVFQNYALYPHMTVRDNIGYALKVHGTPPDVVKQRISDAAQLLGLAPYLDRKPKHLSGGQRQRVAIGRAIVRQPQVFLFDEPLSNLDAKLRVEMRSEIKLLQRRLKTTAVYVTHDQVEAMTMADRVIVMRNGLIEQIADPMTLYEKPANKFVANFIGSPAMNFLPADITAPGIVVAGQKLVLAKHDVARLKGKKRVLFGIRPEHLRANESKCSLQFTPDVVEPLGAHKLLVGTLGDLKFIAQVDPRFPAEAGKPCKVPVDISQAHFFDMESEGRL